MRLLNVKDAENIVAFSQENSTKPVSGQKILTNIFDELLLTRNFMFNSRLLCLADTDNDEIRNLFAVVLPPPTRKDASVSLVAYCEDSHFMNAALEKFADLTEEDSFTKIKLQIESHLLSDSSVAFLKSEEFEDELRIKTTAIDVIVLSFFFVREAAK